MSIYKFRDFLLFSWTYRELHSTIKNYNKLLKRFWDIFAWDLLVIKTHLKKYQISINKFSRFSFIQLNLSRIAFDNQKLQQTIEKILRYFCMGFSCHQNPSKKYQISINKFSRFLLFSWTYRELHSTIKNYNKLLKRFWDNFAWDLVVIKTHLINIKYRLTNFRDFFYQLNLSRIAFDNQKLQQTIEKILRYFCMDLLVIKTHLKKYPMSINKFSRFSFIQLNLSRIAFDNQKLQQTIEKIWDIFAWDLLVIKPI